MRKKADRIQAGDVTISGETVTRVQSGDNKVQVTLTKNGTERTALWGKRSTIFCQEPKQ